MGKNELQNENVSLTSGSTLATFEKIEAEFAAELAEIAKEEQSKKPPHKSSKAVQTPPPSQLPVEGNAAPSRVTPEEIEEMVCFPFNLFFNHSEKPNLSPMERRSLSKAMSDLFNKYAPFMGGYSVEITAFVAVGGIFASRMDFSKIVKKKEKTEKPTADSSTDKPANVVSTAPQPTAKSGKK